MKDNKSSSKQRAYKIFCEGWDEASSNSDKDVDEIERKREFNKVYSFLERVFNGGK